MAAASETQAAAASSGVPPIVVVVLVLGVVEAASALMGRLRFKRAIAYVRMDDWARRHGL